MLVKILYFIFILLNEAKRQFNAEYRQIFPYLWSNELYNTQSTRQNV